MDNLIQANVQMTKEQYERLVQIARAQNTSVSEVIKQAVTRYSLHDWREKMKNIETKHE